MDNQTKAPTDLIRYDLRLDRQTIRELAAIAKREGCGIGSLIRAYCRRGIASEHCAQSTPGCQPYLATSTKATIASVGQPDLIRCSGAGASTIFRTPGTPAWAGV